jgi:hypothetical protein
MRHAAGCVSELTGAHEALVAERSYGPFGPILLPNGPDATHWQKWIARPEEAEAL